MNHRYKRKTFPGHERGIALIEALISTLILSVGILGVVGLQAAMVRSTGSAKYRADAMHLSSGLLGLIWSDKNNITKYDNANCGAHPRCKEWLDQVASRLPGGAASISADASGNVDISITWTTVVEGKHSYENASKVAL